MPESVDKETEIAIVRRAYAMNLLAQLGVSEPRLLAAYAAVPREHYLGPGPWSAFQLFNSYASTPSDDPVYIYWDRLIGLIPEHSTHAGRVFHAMPGQSSTA